MPRPYKSSSHRIWGQGFSSYVSKWLVFLIVFSTSIARSEEVFVGNPGKSLNFFHFDLAIERGFFKELGLDVKLLSTKCDIAVMRSSRVICRPPAASDRHRALSQAKTFRCAR